MTPNEPASELHRLASDWLGEGVPVPEVQRRLAERGVSGADATATVDAVLAERTAADTAARRSRDRAALIQGVCLCVGALALVGIAFSPVAVSPYRLGLIAASSPLLIWGLTRLIQART